MQLVYFEPSAENLDQMDQFTVYATDDGTSWNITRFFFDPTTNELTFETDLSSSPYEGASAMGRERDVHCSMATLCTPRRAGWTRFWGGVRLAGGLLETGGGVIIGVGTSWTGVGAVAGGGIAVHGADTTQAGGTITGGINGGRSAEELNQLFSKIPDEFGNGSRNLPTKPQVDGVPTLPRSPSSAPISSSTKPGTYVFVRDADGVIHVVPDGPGLHPTVLGDGKAASAAGEITIGSDGVVKEINNISYTFQFDADILPGVKAALERLGLSVADDAVKPFSH